MYFIIPKRFLNEYIFIGTLYEDENRSMDKEIYNQKLRSFEFREKYEQNLLQLRTKSLSEISDFFKLTFHIDDKGHFSKVGSGLSVYVRIRKTKRLITDPLDFYYIPQGLKHEGTYLVRLDQMLNYAHLNKESSKRSKINFEIEPCPLSSEAFLTMEKKYNCCINVYNKSLKASSFTYKCYRYSIDKPDAYILNLHHVPECNKYILIINQEEYFDQNFKCPNEGCRHVFYRQDHYDRHLITCTKSSTIKVQVKQKEIKNSDLLISRAREFGLIKSDPINENFVFYDVESALPKSDIKMKKTTVLSTHKLISIAANAYVNGTHSSKVWTVDDMSEKSQIALVQNFLDFCLKAKSSMKVDTQLKNDLDSLKELSGKFHVPNFDMDEISALIQILRPFQDLSIFGYNNSRYDNKMIFPFLIKCLDEKGFVSKDINILKKGTSYFSIRFKGLSFKDLQHFTIPISLDKYMSTWLKESHKLTYPYELFSSIEDVRNCTTFPSVDCFYSAIKGPVDPDLYAKCKEIYEVNHNLPPTHENHWPNFESYLKFYNLSDVEPASRALLLQFKTYKENFGLSPMQFMGLPSFSRQAMLKSYDKSTSSIFTFFDKSTTDDFREQIIGGLTNVYHRHVTTQDEPDCAYSAKFNADGKKWAHISFYDVNAMYPSTFCNKFPCGIGFRWLKKGKYMVKSLMTTKKISIESIQWLDYVQRNDERLVNKAGKRVKLQFGWGSNEHKIGYYYVDGYAVVDEKQIIYEFDGCYFHACEICKRENIAKHDQLRKDFLASLKNVEVVRMSGCKWESICKNLEMENSQISKLLLKSKVLETDLIKYVNQNKLYGFILCDIAPTAACQKFLDVNWPPIIFKDRVNYEDLPDWMQINSNITDFPRKTVVQGMFRNNILLHTDLLAFYLKNGFKISKLHKFYEYEGAKCLKPVYDAVYKARVEATQTGDTLKATAVKLVSNSMYGQMLMVSS